METKKIRGIIWIVLITLIFIGFGLFIDAQMKINKQTERMFNDYAYIVQLEQIAGVGKLKSVHEHVDFEIYIHGEEIDLNKEEFQAPEFGSVQFWAESGHSKFLHLHDGKDYYEDVIHLHAEGLTLGMFLTTIDAEITGECIRLPRSIDPTTYCSDEENTLKVFVNDKPIKDFDSYQFKDLDRMLISFGSENDKELGEQRDSVKSFACISSENCLVEE